jgi:hypothetical protein
MRRHVHIWLSVSILALVLFTPNVSADSDSGTTTIESGHYLALPITARAVLEIEYQIDVISGPNIDVILTDDEGFQMFNSLFSSTPYLVSGSRLDTAHASVSVEVDKGEWYLIIDNSLAGSAEPWGQAVTISYEVTTSLAGISLGDGSYLNIEAVTIIVAIVIIVVALVIVGLLYERSEKKKRGAKKIPVHVRQTVPGSSMSSVPKRVNFCPDCGKPVQLGASFCERCGRRLS